MDELEDRPPLPSDWKPESVRALRKRARRDVPRDHDEGRRWLQRAAAWGSATAKAMLAER